MLQGPAQDGSAVALWDQSHLPQQAKLWAGLWLGVSHCLGRSAMGKSGEIVACTSHGYTGADSGAMGNSSSSAQLCCCFF